MKWKNIISLTMFTLILTAGTALAYDHTLGHLSVWKGHQKQWSAIVAHAEAHSRLLKTLEKYDSSSSSSSSTSTAKADEGNRQFYNWLMAQRQERYHPTAPSGFKVAEEEDGLKISWNGSSVFNSSVYWTFSLHTSAMESASTKVCTATCYSSQYKVATGLLNYNHQYHAYVQKIVSYDGKTYKSEKAHYSFIRSDKTAPVFPSSLVASVDASGTINLSWPHATDNVCVDGYWVQIANDSTFTDVILDGWLDYVGDVAPQARCSYLNPRATPYYCRVIAVDSSDNSSILSASVTIPLDGNDQVGPVAPKLSGGVSDGMAYARWPVPEDASGVRGYRVQVSTNASFTGIIEDSYLNVEEFSVDIGSAREVHLRVCAQDTKGNWGGWSQSVSVDNTIPAVRHLTALQYDFGRVGLGWSGVADATVYEAVISTSPDFSAVVASETTGQRTCSFDISESGVYHARVRGVVGSQKGPWTAVSFGIQAQIGVDVFKDVVSGMKNLGWSVAGSAQGIVAADGQGTVQRIVRRSDGTLVRSGKWSLGAYAVAASDEWWAASDIESDGGRVFLQRWSDSYVRQTLSSPNPEPTGYFGAILTLDGEWLFVGAPDENGLKGRVYVYRLVAGAWQLRQTLETAAGGYFGDAISASGEWLFVGAPYCLEDSEDSRGRCHVYRLAASGLWKHFQNIAARQVSDRFGITVAVDGLTAAVGLPADYTIGGENGGVELLTFDGTAWTHGDYLQPSLWGSREKGWGSAIAMKGPWLAVGVGFEDDDNRFDSTVLEECGSVVLFHRENGSWREVRRQYAPDARSYQTFGSSIVISGNSLVVGAPGDNADGTSAGAIYTFELPSETALQYCKPNVDGIAVSVSDGRMRVGSRDVLTNGFDACEIQIADNASFENPWIFVSDLSESVREVCLHPGTYLMRIRGRRNGHWSGWTCSRFVSTISDAEKESPGLVKDLARPNLTFEADDWLPRPPVYLAEDEGGEPSTSFVKGNVGVIRLYCCIKNLGACDSTNKFAVWHRIYDGDGTCVYSASCTNDSLKAGYGFYWAGNDFGMMSKLSYGHYRYVCTLDEDGWVDEQDESDNTWEIPFDVTVPIALTTPSCLLASEDETTSYVALSWNASSRKDTRNTSHTAADHYVVQRTVLEDGIWKDVATVDGTSYLDCSVVPGVTYRYRIVALQDGNYSSIYCSEPSAVASGRALAVDEKEYMVIDISGGTSASKYPVSYLNAVPDGGWTAAHASSNVVLRKVGGNVASGELTPHYVGVFEITQRQWELVMGNRPSWFRNDDWYGLRPVESVTYDQVAADRNSDSFLMRLRQKTGLDFDLPTPDEWEYFCRAGTTTDFNDGTNCKYPSEGGLPQLARYSGNSGYDNWSDYTTPWLMDASIGTSIIGQYRSNNWGLFDMHGNVSEMCKGMSVSTSRLGSFTNCVVRGGSWRDDADDCMSSCDGLPQTLVVNQNSFCAGFRIVLETSYTGQGYRIVYDGAGATSGVPSPKFCLNDRVYALPAGGLRKSGSTFVGWACSNGKLYDDGMLIFNLAKPGETVTMTAVWE